MGADTDRRQKLIEEFFPWGCRDYPGLFPGIDQDKEHDPYNHGQIILPESFLATIKQVPEVSWDDLYVWYKIVASIHGFCPLRWANIRRELGSSDCLDIHTGPIYHLKLEWWIGPCYEVRVEWLFQSNEVRIWATHETHPDCCYHTTNYGETVCLETRTFEDVKENPEAFSLFLVGLLMDCNRR